VRGLSVFDAQGRLRATTFNAAQQMVGPAAERDWFSAQRSGTGPSLVIGRLEQDRSGAWLLPVSQRIGGPGAAFEGVLVAAVDMGATQRVFDAVDTGRNGFVTLFLAQGWLVATAPANAALFARPWRDTPMFTDHLPHAPVGTVQQVVVRDSTERVYSYRALADFPVVVSIGVSLTDALAEWRNRCLWNLLLLGIVSTALLRAAVVAGQAALRRDEVRAEVETSEKFLRELTDSIPLRIAYVDRELRYLFVNRAHCERFKLPREAIVGHTREELTSTPVPADLQAELERVLQGESRRFEYAERMDGRTAVIETHIVPNQGDDGQVLGFYAASADVTERHQQQQRIEQALAERETLLREVYHRVKNNLQVIQSLLSLQRRALPEGPARSALDDSVQRVRAMALVHEKLYQTGDLSAVALADYSRELVQQVGEAAAAGPRGISLHSEVEAVQAGLDVCVPYGLLVTELVGNSLKHAFPNGRGGSIRVTLRRVGKQLHLAVADDGVGLPRGFDLNASRSMGLQLAASLAGQLGGNLHARNEAGEVGAVFTTALPRLG
jgi:PAS domain S-box-containing protein